MNEAKIKARIDELIATHPQGIQGTSEWASELLQGVLSMLTIAHGSHCPQISSLMDRVTALQKSKEVAFRVSREIGDASLGALKNLKREVEEGLVGNLRKEVTGEVLGDFVQLAKVTLDEGTEEAKNVAAVLAAAAFEDTIRRLGALYCSILTRDALPDILFRLKSADVLKGSQVGVVQSHFQFRNDAMHADWKKIDTVPSEQ